MGCYFLVNIYVDDPAQRSVYDEYVRAVKPIVESYGGEYLLRTEELWASDEDRKPDRLIVIRFPDRKHLDDCFASGAYRRIADLRLRSVRSRVLIAEGK